MFHLLQCYQRATRAGCHGQVSKAMRQNASLDLYIYNSRHLQDLTSDCHKHCADAQWETTGGSHTQERKVHGKQLMLQLRNDQEPSLTHRKSCAAILHQFILKSSAADTSSMDSNIVCPCRSVWISVRAQISAHQRACKANRLQHPAFSCYHVCFSLPHTLLADIV